MTISRASAPSLLRPNLRAVFGDYPFYEGQWGKMYEKRKSNKNYEIDQEMSYLPAAQIIPEGQPFAMGQMGQRSAYKYTHRKIGLGFSITEEMQEDNLYKDSFPMQAKSLRRSMTQAKETLGAQLFNNGFLSAYAIGDGAAFFSTQHPLDNGYGANTPSVQVDLSEASLEAACITIQQFRDVAGNLTSTKAKLLVVPPQGQFVASRLLNSQFRPETTTNSINALNYGGYVPEGYFCNQFLTLPNSWYIKTDAPNSTIHFERTPVKTSVYTEFQTNNLLCKSTERYSFGVSNWRGWYASAGTGYVVS